MNITTAEIITKIRYLINDTTRSLTDVFEYNSLTNEFSLVEPNVIDISALYVNGVESGVSYSYDSIYNKVTVTSAMSYGDIITVDYTYFNRYSDTELLSYIQNAVMQLSVRNYKDFIIDTNVIFPEPSFEERNLVAVVAATLIDPQNVSYSLPDMSIRAANGAVPTDKMIDQILARFKKNSHGLFGISEI